jgi:hypothetical protein
MTKQLRGAFSVQFSAFFGFSFPLVDDWAYLCELDLENFREIACERARSIN